MKTNVIKKEHSEVEIEVTMSSKELEKYREVVTQEALENLEIDGFRKGKVPQDVAMQHISEMKVLEEMAHRAISEHYITIIQENDIKAIGHPQISITKLAEGSELEFKLVTAVLPEVTLPNYKKVAKEINKKEEDSTVTDEELNDAILNLRKMRAQQEMSQSEDAEKETPSFKDIKEEDLPELDDAFVKQMGPFENVLDFTTKMRENLEAEKLSKALEKKRIALIDGILEESEIDVPEMLITYEVDKMMHEFENNISMSGMVFDDYLSSINKTRDDYRKEWQPQAKKRAQTQLMLNHIAAQENIEPSDEELNTEVEKIMEQYKEHKHIDENTVRSYVSSVLTHQKVFEFLEKQ